MNQLVLFLLVLLSQPSFGQQDTSRVANYRPHDTSDSFSVFMENEDAPRPLPGDVTYSITITVTNIRNKKGLARIRNFL
jgi:hypothetical protein